MVLHPACGGGPAAAQPQEQGSAGHCSPRLLLTQERSFLSKLGKQAALSSYFCPPKPQPAIAELKKKKIEHAKILLYLFFRFHRRKRLCGCLPQGCSDSRFRRGTVGLANPSRYISAQLLQQQLKPRLPGNTDEGARFPASLERGPARQQPSSLQVCARFNGETRKKKKNGASTPAIRQATCFPPR